MKDVLVRGTWKAAGLALMVAGLAGTAEAGAGPPPAVCTPEIDPGSALSAVTLLSGGVMVLTDRTRRRRTK